MKVMIKDVRMAFPQLFKAATINGEGEPAFSATFLVEPGSEAAKAIDAAIEQVAKEKWGAKADAVLKSIRAADKTCLHDGDKKAEYDGFEGMQFVSARNKTRPTVIDRDRAPLSESDGKPYAGCYVNAILDIWPQDNNFGKRVNASLSGVQFFRDGDAFSGGGAAAADEFEDFGGEATGTDPLI